MFASSYITVVLLVALLAVCVIGLVRNASSRSVDLDELVVVRKDGRRQPFNEFVSEVCSTATNKVVKQELDKIVNYVYSQGYKAGFEDMKAQSIEIVKKAGIVGNLSSSTGNRV